MPPMEAIALTKQMAMLNKEVARMAMKQKMAKYLAAFFVHSPDLHPALALLCSCKSFKDFNGLWVLQASQ